MSVQDEMIKNAIINFLNAIATDAQISKDELYELLNDAVCEDMEQESIGARYKH